jgi:ribosomal protein L37AE/L43A
MSSERICPSCRAENVQRVSDIFGADVSPNKVKDVPKSYHPPKAPWAYLQGFVLGVLGMLAVIRSMGPPDGSESQASVGELASTLTFLGVWIAYGTLKTKNYGRKLEEWKETIASKFLCRKCSHAFER